MHVAWQLQAVMGVDRVKYVDDDGHIWILGNSKSVDYALLEWKKPNHGRWRFSGNCGESYARHIAPSCFKGTHSCEYEKGRFKCAKCRFACKSELSGFSKQLQDEFVHFKSCRGIFEVRAVERSRKLNMCVRWIKNEKGCWFPLPVPSTVPLNVACRLRGFHSPTTPGRVGYQVPG